MVGFKVLYSICSVCTEDQLAQLTTPACPSVGTEMFGVQNVVPVPGQQRQVYLLTPSTHVAPC